MLEGDFFATSAWEPGHGGAIYARESYLRGIVKPRIVPDRLARPNGSVNAAQKQGIFDPIP
jgi:hypothetical protein